MDSPGRRARSRHGEGGSESTSPGPPRFPWVSSGRNAGAAAVMPVGFDRPLEEDVLQTVAAINGIERAICLSS